MKENNDKVIKKPISLFAETSVSDNIQKYTTKISKYTAEEVTEMLKSPYDRASELQEVSMWLYYNSGIYNRIINNYAGMNLYDLYLYPTAISTFVKDSKKKTATEKLLKAYVDTGEIFENYNYKSNWRNVGVSLMLQGEVFLFRVKDKNGSIEKEVPASFCKISKIINDGLYKYSINMSKISDIKLRGTMPTQIQALYEKHINGILPPDFYTDDSKQYVLIKDSEAVCLSLNQSLATKSIPPLSYLFPSIIRLMDEELQELQDNRVNNLKLIHMKYLLDEEGEPIIDNNELIKMHRQAKANLPSGVAINTNPLEVTTHTLQRTGSVTASSRETLTELVYNNAGVNSEIFNGNNSNNQAIITGVIADQIYCDILNNAFENYARYMVRSEKSKPLWMPRLVRNTKYNDRELIAESINCGTTGGSRLRMLAIQHFSPIEGLATLDFETNNKIDELFVPLATSYTQSANAEAGRTKNGNNEDTSKAVGDNKDSTNQ